MFKQIIIINSTNCNHLQQWSFHCFIINYLVDGKIQIRQHCQHHNFYVYNKWSQLYVTSSKINVKTSDKIIVILLSNVLAHIDSSHIKQKTVSPTLKEKM